MMAFGEGEITMCLKRIASMMIALGCMTSGAMAAPPTWQGTFFVTVAGPACALSDNTVGEFGTILYRPIINSGDAPEGISLFFTRSAETIISNSGNRTFRGFQTYYGFETGSHVFPNQFTGTSQLTITPSIITPATTNVTISGRINNFFENSPQCNVAISATLLPRL